MAVAFFCLQKQQETKMRDYIRQSGKIKLK